MPPPVAPEKQLLQQQRKQKETKSKPVPPPTRIATALSFAPRIPTHSTLALTDSTLRPRRKLLSCLVVLLWLLLLPPPSAAPPDHSRATNCQLAALVPAILLPALLHEANPTPRPADPCWRPPTCPIQC